MSHPDPHHDPDNVRTDDHPNAKKAVVAKRMGLNDLSKRFAKHAKTFDSLKQFKGKKGLPF